MNGLVFTINGSKFTPIVHRGTYFIKYPCSSKSACFPVITTLTPGSYLLETWGAQGSTMSIYPGGKGGYSKGILRINDRVKAYLYVGAEGTATETTGVMTSLSFNGGGIGKCSTNYPITSGGGGTDIRLMRDSFYNRVIVAGGGGGSSKAYETCIGGVGGGVIGGEGTLCSSSAIKGIPWSQIKNESDQYNLYGTF